MESNTQSNNKADNHFYNRDNQDFIPIACHYAEDALVTKDGQIIQIIQINGINSEEISAELFNIRALLRDVIQQYVTSDKVAIWVHTVRRRTNLDDDATYGSLMAQKIHEIWQQKNYWHDKYVNRLYVTLVYDASKMELKNFHSIINSLSSNNIIQFEKDYLEDAYKRSSIIIEKLCIGLAALGVKKLGLKFEDNKCYSELLFLYKRIIQLSEEQCEVPVADLSEYLSFGEEYAFGSDKIEVIHDKRRKFAAILSLKEYQEISEESIDKFLQIPVEMIVTEVFYYVNKDSLMSEYVEQQKMLKISKDNSVAQAQGLDLVENNIKHNKKFCMQKLSIMIIANQLPNLDLKVKQASNKLSEIGLVHFREDINLERIFWAQLPGNFKFLTRMRGTVIDNIASFASLHHFPTGNQYNIWGRSTTIMRTAKGTPFFANLHDTAGRGDVAIFGDFASGKTTMINFLLSEASKYKVTVNYITNDASSSIFIKANGGNWIQKTKQLFNPLLLDDTPQNRQFLQEFFRIVANHYVINLSPGEEILIERLVKKIFSLPAKERVISKIINSITESEKGGKTLFDRLKIMLEGGDFYEFFEGKETLNIVENSMNAYNLQDFDNKTYIKENFPRELKLLDEFYAHVNCRKSVQAAALYALHYSLLKLEGDGVRRIFVVDNLSNILDLQFFQEIFLKIRDNFNSSQDVFIHSISLNDLLELFNKKVNLDFIESLSTRVILPVEIAMENLNQILFLSSAEVNKLSTFTRSSRMFLLHQDEKSIPLELSIGGFASLIKILSAGKFEIEKYQQIISKYKEPQLDIWVEELFNEFSEIQE